VDIYKSFEIEAVNDGKEATSNAAGSWTFGPVTAGNYTIVGYDPTDTTLDGDAEPHVVVP